MACAVHQVLSAPEKAVFPVVCPIFQLFLLRGCKPAVMPWAGHEQQPQDCPRGVCQLCAAAGLSASSRISACAAESLIQQQNPQAVSKASWKNHLQASHLGGSSH